MTRSGAAVRSAGVWRSLLVILLLGFLAGCENPLQHPRNAGSLNLSNYQLVPNVSMPARLASENCGAQALITAWTSLRPNSAALTELQLRAWKKNGATVADILIAARMRGFTARVQRAQWQSLKRAANSDARALVLFDSTIAFWSPLGWISRPSTQSLYHWAIVAGVGRDDSSLLLAAPNGTYYDLPRQTFLRRWARCDNCLVTISLPKLSMGRGSRSGLIKERN